MLVISLMTGGDIMIFKLLKETTIVDGNSLKDKVTDVIHTINADKMHKQNIFGNGVKIAIIDTGCSNHDLLNGKILGGKNFTKEGSENDFNDLNGHGTHVAGIIAANNNPYFCGVAPNVKLLICKALNNRGEGHLDSIINAINFAVDQKVDIINMSLGCPNNDSGLYNAVKRAVDNNILVVCASGNSGDGNPNTEESDYPGAYEEVIEVGAIDRKLNVSKFSNVNKFIDLVAPGENILSTSIENKYQILSGTSMATPIVSGALALIIESTTKDFNRRLSEMELYATLIKNTKDLNFKKSSQGHGMIYFDLNN